MKPRKPVAFLRIRTAAHYRREAFAAGLDAAGFAVTDAYPNDARPGDAVVVWNRYGGAESASIKAESRGAMVIVAENGYIGRDAAGHQLFALALSQHNGAGRWPAGDAARVAAQGITLRPWRESGSFILVLPQRGIGPEGVGMPKGWAERMMEEIRRRMDMPVVVRPHPGTLPAQPLEDAIKDCWAVVTWGSGAAIKALALGVPAFHAMPNWIGAPAARHVSEWGCYPYLGDRAPMFERLSGAQVSLDEIASGAAFRRLLECR